MYDSIFVRAQSTPAPQNFGALIKIFIDLINTAIPVVAGLALLAFLFGLTKFILNSGGNQKGIDEGKKLMFWGLIALFVMVSLWGIISFLSGELGFAQPGLPLLPPYKL